MPIFLFTGLIQIQSTEFDFSCLLAKTSYIIFHIFSPALACLSPTHTHTSTHTHARHRPLPKNKVFPTHENSRVKRGW